MKLELVDRDLESGESVYRSLNTANTDNGDTNPDLNGCDIAIDNGYECDDDALQKEMARVLAVCASCEDCAACKRRLLKEKIRRLEQRI